MKELKNIVRESAGRTLEHSHTICPGGLEATERSRDAMLPGRQECVPVNCQHQGAASRYLRKLFWRKLQALTLGRKQPTWKRSQAPLWGRDMSEDQLTALTACTFCR